MWGGKKRPDQPRAVSAPPGWAQGDDACRCERACPKRDRKERSEAESKRVGAHLLDLAAEDVVEQMAEARRAAAADQPVGRASQQQQAEHRPERRRRGDVVPADRDDEEVALAFAKQIARRVRMMMGSLHNEE